MISNVHRAGEFVIQMQLLRMQDLLHQEFFSKDPAFAPLNFDDII